MRRCLLLAGGGWRTMPRMPQMNGGNREGKSYQGDASGEAAEECGEGSGADVHRDDGLQGAVVRGSVAARFAAEGNARSVRSSSDGGGGGDVWIASPLGRLL